MKTDLKIQSLLPGEEIKWVSTMMQNKIFCGLWERETGRHKETSYRSITLLMKSGKLFEAILNSDESKIETVSLFPSIHSRISVDGVDGPGIESVALDTRLMYITTKKGELFEVQTAAYANNKVSGS